MSSSRSQERVDELEAQVKYLQTQLGQLMEEKRRWNRSPSHSRTHVDSDESEREEKSYLYNLSDEDVPRRHQRRQGTSLGDFRVDILEFEGQLDPDHFLDWLQTIERVFEYKDVAEDKKVKLVALKL